MSRNVSHIAQAQRERLAYLELRAFFAGELRRADIESRFGVKPAASTRDIGIYRGLAPANLDYDPAGRCYRPARAFKPLFEFSHERVLAWLAQGFGDGLELDIRRLTPCEGPGFLVRPDFALLSRITRAIHGQRALRVNYLSLSSGESTREIVPVALADNGARWHVRAYDRKNARFSDFVLTRIVKAKELDGQIADVEQLTADEQWMRMVDLRLVPHPAHRWPKAIVADYSMTDGALQLRARAALVGYVLRRWAVDCSTDHRLDPESHHLWLSNAQALYQVESASLAPGYATLVQEGGSRVQR